MLTRPLLTRLLTGAKPGGPRSPHWPAVRALWLKDHPACAACGGMKMLEVHHIIPVSWPDGHLTELAPSNFVTLCEYPSRNCHFIVGHLLLWASRNSEVLADAAAYLEKVKNRPRNPGSAGE